MTETGTGLRVSMMPGAPMGGGLQHNHTASILAPSSAGNGGNNVLMSTVEDPYSGLNTKGKNTTNQSSLVESLRRNEPPTGNTPGFNRGVINTATTSNSPYVNGRDSTMLAQNRAYSAYNDERNFSHT